MTAVDATLSVTQLQLIILAGVVSPSDYQNLPGGGDKLSNFEQGFVDALLARMGTETTKLSLYQANHEKYLKAARSRAVQ